MTPHDNIRLMVAEHGRQASRPPFMHLLFSIARDRIIIALIPTQYPHQTSWLEIEAGRPGLSYIPLDQGLESMHTYGWCRANYLKRTKTCHIWVFVHHPAFITQVGLI